MRRNDREIKDFNEIIKVIEQCDVLRLALNDDGCPYILPLNFGMKVEENKIIFFFHGATKGKKYELIKKDNRASFEMDCAHRLVTDIDKGYCTMEYKSVIGKGKIELVPETEKYDALCTLMKHYHKEDFPFNKASMPRTTAMKLIVDHFTAKARIKTNN